MFAVWVGGFCQDLIAVAVDPGGFDGRFIESRQTPCQDEGG